MIVNVEPLTENTCTAYLGFLSVKVLENQDGLAGKVVESSTRKLKNHFPAQSDSLQILIPQTRCKIIEFLLIDSSVSHSPKNIF